jgi:predicted transglutaminase-like cysteine proteinase
MRHALPGRWSASVISRTIPGISLAIGLALIGAATHARPAQGETGAGRPSAGQAVAVRDHSAKPTMAWIRFCQQYPAECAVDASEPATIRLTPAAWRTMVKVNRQVNQAIKPMTDMEHWGVEDRWDFAEDGYGDCEDYQLVKRRKLVQAGFPRRALRMTVVIDELGQGHAVMMVRTTQGDYILDNKHDKVLPWSQTGYTYVKREGDAGSAWASLGNVVAPPIATAGR